MQKVEGNIWNSKQKIKTIAGTLAVATAISAATTLPVDLVQQVQALDEGNGVTLTQNSIEPTKKAELKAELDKVNKESEDAATALEQAKVDRIDALVAYNDAKSSYEEQEHAYGVAHDDINGTIQQARIDRGYEYDAAKENYDRTNASVESQKKEIANKKAALDIEQTKYNSLKNAIDAGEIPDNEENQKQLKELNNNIEKMTNDLKEAETNLEYTNDWVVFYTKQLAAAQQKKDNSHTSNSYGTLARDELSEQYPPR